MKKFSSASRAEGAPAGRPTPADARSGLRPSADAALTALRALHKGYVRSCGSRFSKVPFRSAKVPGFIFYPAEDVVREA